MSFLVANVLAFTIAFTVAARLALASPSPLVRSIARPIALLAALYVALYVAAATDVTTPAWFALHRIGRWSAFVTVALVWIRPLISLEQHARRELADLDHARTITARSLGEER